MLDFAMSFLSLFYTIITVFLYNTTVIRNKLKFITHNLVVVLYKKLFIWFYIWLVNCRSNRVILKQAFENVLIKCGNLCRKLFGRYEEMS
jgi:hypothetical protein